jgi:hypothetical protein
MNEAIQKMQRPALAAAVVGLLATGAGYFVAGREQFFQSYLMAFLYVLAFACGSLGFLMIHHLVIARWGLVIQRPLEAATRTFPLLVVLFVPILLGMHELYSWTHAEAAHDHVLVKKAAWLNETAFYIRAVIYFALWLGLSYALSHWSQRQDQRPEEAVKLQLRMRKLSGIGLVVFGLAVTFAAFDWIMSIEPKWFSTIFGSLVMVSQGISALCLMAIVVHRLRGVAPNDRLATTQQFHDIGNFMFAFTILWTYMSASQYIIIWSANLPEEIEYYLHRAHGGWPEFAGAIAVLLFAIPFLVMLFKANKKRSTVLAGIAVYLLLLRPMDLLWMVTPVFRHHVHVHWLDVAALVGLTGVWLVAFLRQLGARPLVPQNDPRFRHMLGHPEEKDEGWESDASDA